MKTMVCVIWLCVTVVLIEGCNVGGLCDYAHSVGQPSVFCLGTDSSPPLGPCGSALPNSVMFACNLDKSLGTPTMFSSPPVPGECGVLICAETVDGAVSKAASAAGVSPSDPRLSCSVWATTMMGIISAQNPTWTTCVSKEGTCKPCDDGQGGSLQSVGEHCGPAAGPYCCHGLTCVGYAASTMGECQGELQCDPAPCGMIGDTCNNASTCCQPPTVATPLTCSTGTEDSSGTCCKDERVSCASDGECCGPNSDHGGRLCRGGACCIQAPDLCGFVADPSDDGPCCPGTMCTADPSSATGSKHCKPAACLKAQNTCSTTSGPTCCGIADGAPANMQCVQEIPSVGTRSRCCAPSSPVPGAGPACTDDIDCCSGKCATGAKPNAKTCWCSDAGKTCAIDHDCCDQAAKCVSGKCQ